MKKSSVVQELVNVFPPWARTRTSDQSVGYTFLNVLAQPMERLQKTLSRTGANVYPSTANLDEIDLTFKVALPETFQFDVDNTDPIVPVQLPPTVSGLLDGTWHPVVLADPNTVEAFWYDSLPNRGEITATVTGVDHELLTMPASGVTESGDWDHHLGGGDLWVETVGGARYLKTLDGKLYRGRVILRGTNRQGMDDAETLIFPWDMKQKTTKEWSSISKIEVYDMEDTVDVILTSANFNAEERLTPYNIAFSENRKKIDTFYGMSAAGNTLQRIGYVSDEWQQLVAGFVDKEVKEEWELLNQSGNTISGVDMALQPFTDLAWVATVSGVLYCYDTHSDMVSGFELVRDRTPGSEVQIDLQQPGVLLGEDIEFMPWHARPVQEIRKWRLWYQTPSGQKYGYLDGEQVSYTSNFWIQGRQLARNIGNASYITADERGEYLIVLEAIFMDDTQHTDKVLVPVRHKHPLTQITVSGISGVTGIDFDSDQKMWLQAGGNYYQVDLHKDIMLIDYQRKTLYFHEPYEQVGIETDG
jgi:hypothetical protein